LSLAVTASFWVWSIEAQVYALGFLALAMGDLSPDPTLRPSEILWVGILHGLAVLGHVFAWGVDDSVLYWMLRKVDPLHIKPFRRIRSYLICFSLTVLLPYLAGHFGSGSLPAAAWSAFGSGSKAAQHSPQTAGGPGILQAFRDLDLVQIDMAILVGKLRTVSRHTRAVGTMDFDHFIHHHFYCPFDMRRKSKTKSLSRFSWLWIGVYGLFLSTWEPSTLCYRMTDILPLGILLALGFANLPASGPSSAHRRFIRKSIDRQRGHVDLAHASSRTKYRLSRTLRLF